MFFVVGPIVELVAIADGERIDAALDLPPHLRREGKYRGCAPDKNLPDLLFLTHTRTMDDAYKTVRKSLLRCEPHPPPLPRLLGNPWHSRPSSRHTRIYRMT